MGCRFAVCLLSLIVFSFLASAADLKLTGELHYNYAQVTLQNIADHNVSFTFKAQLKQKEGSEWKLLKELDCSANLTIAVSEATSLNCSYPPPELPGEYKIYARASIENGTFTYKDFPFAITGSGFKEPEPAEGVVIEAISVPERVKTGEEFFVAVNVTSYYSASLDVYSYTYDGKKCFSLNGWQGNMEKYKFEAGQERSFNLSDSVVHDAVNGTYKIKVRARDVIAGKDYDLIRDLEVEQVPVDLFKDLDKAAPAAKAQKNQSGEPGGLPVQLLLPLIGSIPLILLLVKKIF